MALANGNSSSIKRLATESVYIIKSKIGILPQDLQVRLSIKPLRRHGGKNYWPEWSMIKDQRKRMTLKEYGPTRLRLVIMKKADILPEELREIVFNEVTELPRDSGFREIVFRCVMTSRARGNVFPWNVSRHMFRRFADYNRLSGVQRAMW